jgi:hypothetical protein
MVGWALSLGLIDLPFSHWTHATFTPSTRFNNVDIRVTTLSLTSHAVLPARSRPAAPLGPAAGGAEMRMRRRVGPLRVTQLLRPARGPQSPCGSRGRRCRDVPHASTRGFRGPRLDSGPGWAHGRAVPLRVAPCSSAAVRSWPAGPVGSRGWRCLAEHAVGAGHRESPEADLAVATATISSAATGPRRPNRASCHLVRHPTRPRRSQRTGSTVMYQPGRASRQPRGLCWSSLDLAPRHSNQHSKQERGATQHRHALDTAEDTPHLTGLPRTPAQASPDTSAGGAHPHRHFLCL